MKLSRLLKLYLFLFLLISVNVLSIYAGEYEKKLGEALYNDFLDVSKTADSAAQFQIINGFSNNLNWDEAEELSFVGNLRVIKNNAALSGGPGNIIYLIRTTEGEVFILSIPQWENIGKDSTSPYADISGMLESKMDYKVFLKEGIIDGRNLKFVRLSSAPNGLVFDKIFKISMIMMLFFVMTGMGMTLSVKDFKDIAKSPRGILIGSICQFILMPLIAYGLGRLLGYDKAFPFIFVGMILITATPGGATSNLMTFLAKGDLALSISMTALATVLSLFVTPLILIVLCSNIPDINMPLNTLLLTIFVLVLLPLLVGMFIRKHWQKFADKATPYFSILGIISVLFIGAGGVISNLEVFSDISEKLGITGYLVFFSLTALGMILGAIAPKLFSINNYQTRAISMEIGIRNVSLGMTISLLIQDRMGDFNSHMFAVSGIFALFMYGAGILAIFSYKNFLPVNVIDVEV